MPLSWSLATKGFCAQKTHNEVEIINAQSLGARIVVSKVFILLAIIIESYLVDLVHTRHCL